MKILLTIVIISLSAFALGYAKADNLDKNDIFEIMLTAEPAEIKSMHKSGIDFNVVDSNGVSLISYMANMRDDDVLKTLIDIGVDVNIVNKDRSTPLFWAIASRNLSNVKLLLKHVSNINHKNSAGNTALHTVLKEFFIYTPNIAVELIQSGADVNVLDADGNSPLNILRKQKTYNWGKVEQEIEIVLLSRGAKDISFYNVSK